MDSEYHALNFIANLHSKNSVVRSVIQDVVENASELLKNVLNNVKNNIEPLITNLSENEQEKLKSVFRVDPFHNISTEYMRIKYLKSHNFFIEPQAFYIGSILDNKKSGSSTVNMTFKKCEGQIIPLRKNLKVFLEIPGVLNTILEYQKSEENKNHLSSFFNGEL